MKLFLTSDSHFGVRPLEMKKWLGIACDYYKNFFIPHLKKHGKPGDKVIHLGDVFHNRDSIVILVLNKVLEIFQEITSLGFEIHIIVGNHDLYRIKDTQINAVKIYRGLDNVHVYESCHVVEWNKKKIYFQPWIHQLKEQADVMAEVGWADYSFFHCDIAGAKRNLKAGIMGEIDGDLSLGEGDFKSMGKVFVGHIHIRQELNSQITYVGCPYHMDRNDENNEKGIYWIDLGEDKIYYKKNDYSPEFVKYKILVKEDLLKIPVNVLKKDFIKLQIDKDIIFKDKDFKNFLQDFVRDNHIDIEWIDEGETKINSEIPRESLSWDIEDLLRNKISEDEKNEDKKKKMLEILEKMIHVHKLQY